MVDVDMILSLGIGVGMTTTTNDYKFIPCKLPSDIKEPFKPKPKPIRPARERKRFRQVVDQLQHFVDRHFVFVHSSSCPSFPAARICGFTINSNLGQSALCIFVVPPPEIQQLFDANPRPEYMAHVLESERFHMCLSTYIFLVLTLQDGRSQRMYEDVECTIQWNKDTKDIDRIPLSQWIPSRVMFASFPAQPEPCGSLFNYCTYVSQTIKNKLLLSVFRSPEFNRLFTIPSCGAVVPIGPTISLPVERPFYQAMAESFHEAQIEIENDPIMEEPPIVEDVVMEPLMDTVMDTVMDKVMEPVMGTVMEPVKPTTVKRKRQELACPTRVLRKRVLCKRQKNM